MTTLAIRPAWSSIAMPRWPLRAFAVLACAITPLPALAQERPPLAPTRDVSITYRLLGPRQGNINMRVQASTGLARVDGPNRRGYIIVDRQNHHMTLVNIERRVYTDMPTEGGEQRSPDLDPTARYVRHGTETIAGLACTAWDYTARQSTGSACVTDDGVLLRLQDSANPHGLEATEVSFATQPDADFRPPPDFTGQPMPPASWPLPPTPPAAPAR
jgi:hypothetical protein